MNVLKKKMELSIVIMIVVKAIMELLAKLVKFNKDTVMISILLLVMDVLSVKLIQIGL